MRFDFHSNIKPLLDCALTRIVNALDEPLDWTYDNTPLVALPGYEIQANPQDGYTNLSQFGFTSFYRSAANHLAI